MLKRTAGYGFALLVLTAACDGATGTCDTNADCSDGLICSAAGVCVDPLAPPEGEGEGEVGEGEGETGEGEGEVGEGEGEPVVPTLRVQVGPGRTRLQSERFTLTGGLVGGTAPLVVRGERFTLRPVVGGTVGGN